MTKHQTNTLQSVAIRTYIQSIFDSLEQVQRLREAFPGSIDAGVYDLIKQCVPEGLRAASEECRPVWPDGLGASPRSTKASPIGRFQRLLSAWRSASPCAKRVAWPSKDEVPLLFGSMWTVQCDESMCGQDWGITERLPMVVLAETVEEDEASSAASVVQVFPLSIWPDFATDADLVVNEAPLPQAMMVEVWNEQPLLCSQLLRCLGALPEQDLERLADAATAARTGSSARDGAGSNEHHRGQPLGPADDPRRTFQQIELLRTLPLRVPALIALSGSGPNVEIRGQPSDQPKQAVWVDFARLIGLSTAAAMAASSTDPERRLSTAILRCDSPVVEISVSETVTGGSLAIEVLRDEDRVMPGARVVDDAGAELGAFSQEGTLLARPTHGTTIAVRLTSGRLLRFCEVEE